MNEIALGADLLLLLFFTGMAAGTLDAMAGGGGLITLPVLLYTGLAPTEALATNKLQGSFGTFSASLYFLRQGAVKLSGIPVLIGCTFVGSVLGTLLVQYLDTGFLNRAVPVLLILTALYFWFGPSISHQERQRRIGEIPFALLVGFTVGFYDGFFGPGAGTFFTLGFVALQGFSIIKATAHTKILNFSSNIASLIFFAAGGYVVWSLGLVMASGQLIGGRLGARLVINQGTRLVRPLIVIVSMTISLKLLLSD